MLIDSHCHLDFHKFDDDRDAVIERARKIGVKFFVNAGDDLKSSLAGLELAQANDDIFCTFGVHPNEADKWDKKVEAAFVAAFAEDRMKNDHNIVAIGEIGLDYFRNGASKEVQKTAFREQIHLARREDMPLVIHCRDAFDDVIEILDDNHKKRVVFHCFDGDLETAQRIWEKGWLTSFTGMVSYPKNEELRRVAKAAPANLFMVETDAPFLPHQDFRGKRNEPAFVERLVDDIAELRGVSHSEAAELSSKNALEFYGFTK
jgi:TatD DNase family protein